MNIYDVLFPPDTEYVGWVQFATLTKDKKMLSLGYADFKNIKEKHQYKSKHELESRNNQRSL